MKVFFKSRLFLCDVLSGNYNIVMQTLSEFAAAMTAISLGGRSEDEEGEGEFQGISHESLPYLHVTRAELALLRQRSLRKATLQVSNQLEQKRIFCFIFLAR